MKTLLAAVAVAVLGFSSAYAAEGNSEPFATNTPPAATRIIRQAQAPDTGSAQYPNVIGRPGSNLPLLLGDVLPANGSEGAVQTIAAAAPSSITTLRSATETPEPINAWTTSVSALRREVSSPTRLFSKKPTSSRIRWEYSLSRSDASARSLSKVMQK